MAKQEVYWFKHDGNARRDIKILEMRADWGAEGYGWWWMLVEMMREATGYKLKRKGKYLAKELDATTDQLTQFINDCIDDYELFDADDKYFWSPSMIRRMAAYNKVVETKRAAANARWNRD